MEKRSIIFLQQALIFIFGINLNKASSKFHKIATIIGCQNSSAQYLPKKSINKKYEVVFRKEHLQFMHELNQLLVRTRYSKFPLFALENSKLQFPLAILSYQLKYKNQLLSNSNRVSQQKTLRVSKKAAVWQLRCFGIFLLNKKILFIFLIFKIIIQHNNYFYIFRKKTEQISLNMNNPLILIFLYRLQVNIFCYVSSRYVFSLKKIQMRS
ncbi:unnamed protein product [Paramecium pentaurelia]|uniref:Transmembrane protein n=1 Tax=Paramecium pentaurelia TaxID=43138 RepID=A0A8S1U557_9CILI|nr:unnamed protein product [Paramecium pentaurelia]